MIKVSKYDNAESTTILFLSQRALTSLFLQWCGWAWSSHCSRLGPGAVSARCPSSCTLLGESSHRTSPGLPLLWSSEGTRSKVGQTSVTSVIQGAVQGSKPFSMSDIVIEQFMNNIMLAFYWKNSWIREYVHQSFPKTSMDTTFLSVATCRLAELSVETGSRSNQLAWLLDAKVACIAR